MSDTLDAHLAACEQALERVDQHVPYAWQTQMVVPIASLRAVLHEARQAAAHAALIAAAREVRWANVGYQASLVTSARTLAAFGVDRERLHIARERLIAAALAADGSST